MKLTSEEKLMIINQLQGYYDKMMERRNIIVENGKDPIAFDKRIDFVDKLSIKIIEG